MNWQELKQASLDDILAWAESQPWCRAMADCAQDAKLRSVDLQYGNAALKASKSASPPLA